MSSYDRVIALLRRLSPSFPNTDDDTSVGKELGSIARTFEPVVDVLDTLLDEIFPDSTTNMIARWEKITRNPVRPGDDIDVRRGRVLSVLRRVSGPRLDQLAKVLAESLALDEDEIEFIEMLRQYIDEALTETTGTIAVSMPGGATFHLGKPWPGTVDDRGVDVYIKLSTFGAAVTAILTSPKGTAWVIPVSAAEGTYANREDFLDEPAGGNWKLAVSGGDAATLTEARLMVSNDVDSAQIYNFYVLRDPDAPGTPDLPTAQRLFRHTALGHMRSFVVERLDFIHGDPHSLHGREPHGV